MCELFGFCSAKSYDLTNWLKEFYAHSPNHPDGWGLATFYGNAVSVEKEPLCANDSTYLQNRLSVPVMESLLLAHIRKASVGVLEFQNCHPFVKRDEGGRCWTLIHNGTIFQSKVLEKYKQIQRGSTDSERILLYIVDNIDRLERELGRAATGKERFDTIEESIADIAPGNKVNLMIYDSELFYVHANMASSLHYLKLADGILFSTKPLSDESWCEVPLSTVAAFSDGKEAFRGEDKHHVYTDPIPEEEMQSGMTTLFDGFGI